ncbi:MAG: bifunctional glutamate N-acetyltransferase/amino-acid acetyltransferase ArgJ [Campylobacterota bacterium]|nr:bifunctional glutamate N-acetyltransferase/amino-acid acetyltransferase ArgJ [Campylobacterota bacterium]
MFSIFPIKGTIGDIDGFYCDGINAGLKPNKALDIGFIYSDSICDIEAVFTKNRFKAAPLRHYLNYPTNFQTNFILINSKNANAMTGQKGIEDIDEVLDELKSKFSDITNPIMSSTGVIGVPLPKDKILKSSLNFNLKNKNGKNLSEAIMTTDAYSKSCFYEVVLEDKSTFKIGAVAKGAGMINPNLATMLCFITTDANIPKYDMKELLQNNIETTFNAISVDGDTSTNDTVFLMSNKKSNSYDKEAFSEVLRLVMHDMAMLMVADGEGAKKSVAFEVIGASNDEEAQIAAKALSNSLLVKTALFGEDPNWGRIASTIGASQINCSEDSLSIKFKDVLVYDKGEVLFTQEVEKTAAKVLEESSFKITCDIGLGDGKFTAYGCDLGYEYVKINADYRT